MNNQRTFAAILKAAFSNALISRPDRKARESIAELEATASCRLRQHEEGFDSVMRRVVGDLGK